MTEDDRTGNSSTAEADGVASVPATPRRVRRRPRRGLFRRRPRRAQDPLAARAPDRRAAALPRALLVRLRRSCWRSCRSSRACSTRSRSSSRARQRRELDRLLRRRQAQLGDPHRRTTSSSCRRSDIPPIMAHAIVAIEDKRFYTEPGIDIRGIARAFVADVFGGGGTQGASTITEQFVKIALGQQYHRTVLEKFREAAIAFQLAHRWSKPQILADYLEHRLLRQRRLRRRGGRARVLRQRPAVEPLRLRADAATPRIRRACASPTSRPTRRRCWRRSSTRRRTSTACRTRALAQDRRNLVLRDMAAQGYLDAPELTAALQATAPARRGTSAPPTRRTRTRAPATSSAGSRTSCTQHLDGTQCKDVYTGGYKIHTTLEQPAAGRRADDRRPARCRRARAGPPRRSSRSTTRPARSARWSAATTSTRTRFNLATAGERQPGSAWKVFDLAAALEHGFTPDSTEVSRALDLPRPGDARVRHLRRPQRRGRLLRRQDPALGGARGLRQQRLLARRAEPVRRHAHVAKLRPQPFGITTTISINPSMVIGGLAHRRHAARHGARLRDDRQLRRA